jgi:heme-degrading monooxygenase HmoA
VFVVVFRSRLTEYAGADFDEMSDQMLFLAKQIPNSGFIDLRTYTSEDGERLAVVWWRDKATLDIWRNHVRHRAAQRLGRERWYSFYDIDVAEIIRHSSFDSEDPTPHRRT